MQEIKYLTEKDLEYFYKLEEQGEAVIIRLEPEQLLSLDLSELDRRKADANSEISEEEIQQWLQQHSSELRQRYEENEAVLQENQQMRDALGGCGETNAAIRHQELSSGRNALPDGKSGKQTLVSLLHEVRLNDEQTEIIDYAIGRGWERNSSLSYSEMGGQQMRCANYVRCSYRKLMVDSIRGKENKKCWCMPAAGVI
ncbi:MAG: hypothetical protein LUF27_09740 [Lachnospiraceae bacterium]|nr:hypothetical protein [Lachnospiraceae bacterium]